MSQNPQNECLQATFESAAQATALRAIATKNGGETYFRYANFGKHLVESLPYKGEVKNFRNEFLYL